MNSEIYLNSIRFYMIVVFEEFFHIVQRFNYSIGKTTGILHKKRKEFKYTILVICKKSFNVPFLSMLFSKKCGKIANPLRQ